MHRITSRFGLIVTVGIFMAANVFAQEEPSTASPRLQPNAEPEEAAVGGAGSSPDRSLFRIRRAPTRTITRIAVKEG